MNWSKWIKWFGVYLGLLALIPAFGYVYLKVTQIHPLDTLAGRTVIGVIAAAIVAWCFRGIHQLARGEAGRLTKFLQTSVITLLMTGGIGGVYFTIFAIMPNETAFGQAVFGIWLLVWLFILLIELVRTILSRGGAVLGVAKTVLDEAIRMKIALVFIGMLMVVLPVLPFLSSDDTPVRFRVQTFLTYSLTAMGILLSVMTVFLSCATLSWEIEEKQIYSIAVKPIGRGAHLLGKWIGVVLLNAVLLTISGLAIYGFTVFYLAKQPPKDMMDALKLQQEVLTARVGTQPKPPVPVPELAEMELAKIVKEDPGVILELGRDQARAGGLGDVSEEVMMNIGTNVKRAQLIEKWDKEWKVIPPGEVRAFVFEGLQAAKREAKMTMNVPGLEGKKFVQLLYKADSSGNLPNDEARVLFRINGRDVYFSPDKRDPFIVLSVASSQTLPIPVDVIDEEGRLFLEIQNPPWQDPRLRQTLTFSSRESMEILYHTGGFGGNFFRAMVATLIKLGFLAMLGLMCATFLSFPVAAVLAMLIFIVAMASPYLVDSVRSFGNNPQTLQDAFEFLLKLVGMGVTGLLGQFAEYRTTPLLASGRLFSWYSLLNCFFWIGIVWTSIVGVTGWLIYRKRELAKVQV